MCSSAEMSRPTPRHLFMWISQRPTGSLGVLKLAIQARDDCLVKPYWHTVKTQRLITVEVGDRIPDLRQTLTEKWARYTGNPQAGD